MEKNGKDNRVLATGSLPVSIINYPTKYDEASKLYQYHSSVKVSPDKGPLGVLVD